MSEANATGRCLWVDCPTGLAGNMLLAALLDLGVDPAVIDAPLAQLGLAGAYQLSIEERRSGGLRGRHLEVAVLEEQPDHRHWGALRQQLQVDPDQPLPCCRSNRSMSPMAASKPYAMSRSM